MKRVETDSQTSVSAFNEETALFSSYVRRMRLLQAVSRLTQFIQFPLSVIAILDRVFTLRGDAIPFGQQDLEFG